jgi:hypothetical protein
MSGKPDHDGFMEDVFRVQWNSKARVGNERLAILSATFVKHVYIKRIIFNSSCVSRFTDATVLHVIFRRV